MSEDRRTLLIGLDAADPVLIERWTDDGTLPNLARLRRSGLYGRLETSARGLAGSPWPTFYTGRHPSGHAIYHDFQWRHEDMAYARPSWDWLPSVPFWRRLDPEVRVVAYDVPMTLGCQSASGVEVTGWASHDRLAPPSSHPPELLDEIRAKFGEWSIEPEGFGRSPVSELLDLRRRLIEGTARSAELIRWLLAGDWDLGIVAFGAPHQGGHRLWDRSSLRDPVLADGGAEFDRALRDVYEACDRAVGALVADLIGRNDVTFMVFSLHGMRTNTTRVDLLDGMLWRVLHGKDAEPPKPGVLRRLGEALPLGLRRTLTRAIPEPLQDRMMTMWTSGGRDWSATTAFTLRADLQGYIRINLRGREAKGIVPPGAYDEICEELREGLLSFRDADTGAPIVADVVRASPGLFPEDERSDRLPDLVVLWEETSAADHSALISDRCGRVQRDTRGRIPNGRSGNHRPQGFLIAAGRGIPAGARLPGGADILDLAPTALELVGARTDLPLAGRPLPLVGDAPPAGPA